jgi:hypothetical protein
MHAGRLSSSRCSGVPERRPWFKVNAFSAMVEVKCGIKCGMEDSALRMS